MKKIIVVLFLFASPVFAQLSFDNGFECDNTVNAARGCLKIEASIDAFIGLRDALTESMTDAGGGDCNGLSCDVEMRCTECSVAKNITGCLQEGDLVTITRKSASLHRLACILTSLSDQDRLNDELRTTRENFVPGADIGDGDPQ